MKRILSMTPGTGNGWIATLECGHTRSFDSRPTKSEALCWMCPKDSAVEGMASLNPSLRDGLGRSSDVASDVATAIPSTADPHALIAGASLAAIYADPDSGRRDPADEAERVGWGRS